MGRIEDDDKTIDLGINKIYEIPLPEDCGLACAKLHGIGERENQEDAFGVSETTNDLTEKGLLLVLADGMGGGMGGEVASMSAVVACLEYFEHKDETLERDAWMRDMALHANDKVTEAMGDYAGMGGSTLVALWTDCLRVFWATVGDSRLYLFRDGALQKLNHEHVYAEKLREMVEREEITQEDADCHPQRRALTSYLGIEESKEIDSAGEAFFLERGDWLLLLSDGVFGTLSEEEIAEALQYPPCMAARRLELAIGRHEKRNQDNYTGILLQYR